MDGVVTGDTYPLVLFPSDDAVPIEEVETDLPVTLIVPDGSWRQADKLQRRVPELDDSPTTVAEDLAGPASSGAQRVAGSGDCSP